MTFLSSVKLCAYSVTVVRFVMSLDQAATTQAARVGGPGDHVNVTRTGRRGGCLIMGKIT